MLPSTRTLQSRRDDLESVGYVLLYFLRGNLPWQGLKVANKEYKYNKIAERKVGTPVELLCKGFAPEFTTYMQYCRALRFDQDPDYAYLRKLLRDLFIRQGFEYDSLYDWHLKRVGAAAGPVAAGAGAAGANALNTTNNNSSALPGAVAAAALVPHTSVATTGHASAAAGLMSPDPAAAKDVF